ncbi:MAG: molybdate ABC transporter permease subunit [bacterium]
MVLATLDPDEWRAIVLSVKVGLWCTVVGVPPAVLLGWVLARKEFPGKVLLDGLVHLPLVMPPVATGFLLLVLLGTEGVIGRWLYNVFGVRIAFTWRAAVVASAVVSFPLATRAVRVAMEMVDPGLEEAARTLGAGPVRVFLGVTLPLALPGVVSGAILAFARSLGEFGATITFAGNIAGETRTLPLAVYSYTQRSGGEVAALRLVLVSIVVSFAALAGSELLVRRARRRLGGGR